MVVNRKRIVAVAAALALAASVAPARASGLLEARLGHTVVREGEPVQLVLRSELDGTIETPDLSPLEKDFEILGTQQSQQISIVNGRREASLDWIVTLLPRRTGEIVVPAIAAGSASSEPLTLKVAEAGPPPSRKDAPDLFVESTVDEKAPYVQGEVRYTVKVYDGVGIREGALTEPQIENARVTPIGEGRTYEEVVNGRTYRVHEREYAIAPQTSGATVIPPVVLEARVADPDAGRRSRFGGSPFDDFFADDPFFGGDPFAGFGQGFPSAIFDRMMNRGGREVRVRSNPVSLDVQARPEGAAESWFLPAKHVALLETLEPSNPTFEVGEAVRRTVELRALGASAEQLPDVAIPEVDGIRQYDEGVKQDSVPTDDGIVSVKQKTVALVPERAGRFVLPAIEVSWWDVEAKTARTATVPERTIEVRGTPGSTAPQAPAQASAPAKQPDPAVRAPSAPSHAKTAPASEVASASATPSGAEADPVPLSWLFAAVLASAAIASGAVWAFLRRRSTPQAGGSAGAGAPVRSRDLLDDVQRACNSNDAAAARDALLRWARGRFGAAAPASPAAIARKLGHSGFTAQAAALERSLYAPRTQSPGFDGEAFWRELRAAARAAEAEPSGMAPPVLPELYPTR